MKRAIPLLVLLVATSLYVYFGRIVPSRRYDPVVRGFGTIEATEVVISSKLVARVLEIKVAEGDHVKSGDLLVRLQCDEPEARLAQAQAQFEQTQALAAQVAMAEQQARAQVAPLKTQNSLAAKERERASSLFQSAGATQRALDQADTAFQSSNEQIKAGGLAVEVAARGARVAIAQVNVAEKALALAQTQVDECTLKAPIAGVVLTKSKEPGELVLPGAALLKIGDLTEVHTWIYVPNEEIGRVRVGQEVKLEADTYQDKIFNGKVSRIKEEAEFTPKSIQTKEDRTRLVFGVKVAIPNADEALLPGMPVEAEIVGASKPG